MSSLDGFSGFTSSVGFSSGCPGLTSGVGFSSGFSGFTSGVGFASGVGFTSGFSGFTSGFSGFTTGISSLISGVGFTSGFSSFTSGTELSSTWYLTSTLKLLPAILIVCETLLSTIAVLGKVFWPFDINFLIFSSCSFVTFLSIFCLAFILAIWYETTLFPFNITFTSTSVKSLVATNSITAPPSLSMTRILISLLACTSIFSSAFNNCTLAWNVTIRLEAIITEATPILNFLIENISFLLNKFFILFLHIYKFILYFLLYHTYYNIVI